MRGRIVMAEQKLDVMNIVYNQLMKEFDNFNRLPISDDVCLLADMKLWSDTNDGGGFMYENSSSILAFEDVKFRDSFLFLAARFTVCLYTVVDEERLMKVRFSDISGDEKTVYFDAIFRFSDYLVGDGWFRFGIINRGENG